MHCLCDHQQIHSNFFFAQPSNSLDHGKVHWLNYSIRLLQENNLKILRLLLLFQNYQRVALPCLVDDVLDEQLHLKSQRLG
jgi:hypothetical protein